MKIYTVLILYQIISFLRCVEKSDVIILKDENFDKYIKNNAYVLVKFYAPCKNIEIKKIFRVWTLQETCT